MLGGKEYESTGRTETLLLLNDSSWEWIVFINIVSPIYFPLWRERAPVSSLFHMTFFKVIVENLLEIQHQLCCLAAFFFSFSFFFYPFFFCFFFRVTINVISKQKLCRLLTLFYLASRIRATLWHSNQVPTSHPSLLNPSDFYLLFFPFSLVPSFIRRT